MIGSQTPQLIGEAPSWLAAQEHVSRLAPLDRPCLIIGERGTGKDLLPERVQVAQASNGLPPLGAEPGALLGCSKRARGHRDAVVGPRED